MPQKTRSSQPQVLERDADRQQPSARSSVPPRTRAWLAVVLCIAALVALTAFTFRDHLAGRTSFTFDFPMGYYAGTAYWITSIQAGEWPHWIPYEASGYPAILNPQLGLFYPPLLLFALTGLPYTLHAANVIQVAHIAFGAIGAYLLTLRLWNREHAAALFGGICFLYFGGFFSNAQHPDIIRGFTWTPWLLLCLLVDEQPSCHRLGKKAFRTRLGVPTLLLPLVVAWFLTGSYPGVVVSTLLICGVFVAAQTVVYVFRGDRATAIRDGVVTCGAIALGVAMAVVYLIPTFAMRQELSRTSTFLQFTRSYLNSYDTLHLVFPSNLIARSDYSMVAMQLPLAALLFLPVAIPHLRRILPFLACAAFALMMCVAPARPLTDALITTFPVLGFSRFPSGDYRLFLFLGLLLCSVAGFRAVFNSTGSAAWKNVAWMLAGVAVVLAQAVRTVTQVGVGLQQIFVQWTYWALMAAGAAVAARLLCLRWPQLKRFAVIVPAVCAAATGYLTARQMIPYWSSPDIENMFYTSRQVPLIRGGDLHARSIFSRDDRARPRRHEPRGFLDLSWRGYIDGTYTYGDNIKSASQQRVAANPALKQLVLEESKLLAAACAGAVCEPPFPAALSSALPLTSAMPVRYSRNDVAYEVSIPSRSLIVENELFAPGWNARCDLHGNELPVQRIEGALRGWVVEPGRHRVRLRYTTPLLHAGAAITALSYAAWILLLVIAWRAFRSSPDRQELNISC